jgi:dipeptidyl aminopeptidase/acylaminoacyl peptidase
MWESEGQQEAAPACQGRCRYATTIAETHPVWSPDGTQLAFSVATADEISDIVVLPPDGSAPIQVTSTPGDVQALAWSPDGAALAFAANQPEQGPVISVVAAAGGEPSPVTDQPLTVPWLAWVAEPAPETATDTSTIVGMVAEFDATENAITLEKDADGYTRIVFEKTHRG